MDVQMVPAALRERLGADATLGLAEVFGEARNEWVADVTELSTERFERRLTEEVSGLRVEILEARSALRQEMAAGDAGLRQEMTGGFAAIRLELAGMRQEMAANRFELIKWSFVFWVGQVMAVAAILGVMLHRV
jgi:hypothetical protein